MPEENVLFATEADVEALESGAAEVQTDKYLIFVSDELLYGMM